jgi:hypothetical protein
MLGMYGDWVVGNHIISVSDLRDRLETDAAYSIMTFSEMANTSPSVDVLVSKQWLSLSFAQYKLQEHLTASRPNAVQLLAAFPWILTSGIARPEDFQEPFKQLFSMECCQLYFACNNPPTQSQTLSDSSLRNILLEPNIVSQHRQTTRSPIFSMLVGSHCLQTRSRS